MKSTHIDTKKKKKKREVIINIWFIITVPKKKETKNIFISYVYKDTVIVSYKFLKINSIEQYPRIFLKNIFCISGDETLRILANRDFNCSKR